MSGTVERLGGPGEIETLKSACEAQGARLDTLRGPLQAHFDEEERARLFETIEECAPEHAVACSKLRAL